MNKKEYDLLLKIIINGDSSIGKTALLDRYTNNEFLDEDRYLSTIGIDFKIHYEKIFLSDINNEYTCKLQIWDTAGQERFRSITQSYYRCANICLVCFDATILHGQRSIESVPTWISDIRKKGSSDELTMIYVVGTKLDILKNNDYEIYEDIIREINLLKNVKFIGLCSAKYNIYKPYIEQNINNNVQKIISELSNYHSQILLPIDTMFRIIIEDCIMSTYLSPIIEDDKIQLNNSTKKSYCCS